MLQIERLSVRYRTKDSTTYAVDDVSLSLGEGEVLALVGESGSGKTTVGMSILRLLPGEAEITSGRVVFDGRDLLTMSDDELRHVRGRRISMVFQDPVAGLNPVLSIGEQVSEALESHLDLGRREARRQATAILGAVGLPDPDRVAKSYPFQLSGGMCQRVMIGIATALDPEILVADEPTSSLDVTVQAQILRQLEELRQTKGTSVLLITHDFGVVAQMAEWVAVIYGGRLMEIGRTEDVLTKPLHPYSDALLATLPRLDYRREQLSAIRGSPPELSEPAEHCPFLDRCNKALSVCRTSPPPHFESQDLPGRSVACYNPVWHG
ncbi:MAG: ABC transporter ATP-binding protein [Dehalococcoidia bacterium]